MGIGKSGEGSKGPYEEATPSWREGGVENRPKKSGQVYVKKTGLGSDWLGDHFFPFTFNFNEKNPIRN